MRLKLLPLFTAFAAAVSLFGAASVKTKAADEHIHKLCVGSSCTDDSHGDIHWTAWNGGASLNTGNYYLSGDVTLTQNLTIPGDADVNLCLNGYVLNLNGDNRINVEGNLNICDCGENRTTHKFSSKQFTVNNRGTFSGLWELNENSGTHSIKGGVITGSISGQNLDGESWYNQFSSAIMIRTVNNKSGALSLYSGNICGNIEGAVGFESQGSFAMHGGKICGNVGEWSSAVSPNWSANSIVLDGGEISNNISVCGNDYGLGGAVHIEENNVSLGGSVKIKDNHYITKTGEFAAGDLVVDGTNRNNYCFSITSALTDEADIGLYAWYEGKVGESLTGHTITKSDLAKFTLQNPKYDLRLTDDNSIELCKPHTAHTWSEDWSVDDTYHWHECTYPDCSLADNSQKDGYEEHKWNSGIITIPATEENEGVRTFTCTICGKTKTESIPKLPSGDVSKPDVSSVPETSDEPSFPETPDIPSIPEVSDESFESEEPSDSDISSVSSKQEVSESNEHSETSNSFSDSSESFANPETGRSYALFMAAVITVAAMAICVCRQKK